ICFSWVLSKSKGAVFNRSILPVALARIVFLFPQAVVGVKNSDFFISSFLINFGGNKIGFCFFKTGLLYCSTLKSRKDLTSDFLIFLRVNDLTINHSEFTVGHISQLLIMGYDHKGLFKFLP